MSNEPHQTRRASRGSRVAPAIDRASRAIPASAGPALDNIVEDLRALAVPIAELNPAPDNARKHSLTRDVLALMESLRRYGQQKAAVGKREYRGVTNAVICGNGTLLAAQRLGWSHLAVSWFDGTDDEARAYAVVDNRTAELSEWNLDVLARDVAEIDLSAWFAPVDLADLLGNAAPLIDFPAVEVSAQGRLDQLGDGTCPTCGAPRRRREEGA